MSDPATGSDEAGRLRRIAATASLSLAVFLSLTKLAAAIATDSLAILTSLIDSLADIAASGITWFCVRISQQPPDHRHRYGHGKAESLSALAQAALVSGTAVFILVEAIQRFVDPVTIRASSVGYGVMLLAIVLTIALVLFQKHVIRKTGSQAIAADSLHYSADLATNLGVLLSIWLASGMGWLQADPVIALLIAGYLLFNATIIGRDAIDVLMDHELPGDRRETIKQIVSSNPDVEGFHDLRTREAGTTQFIELHVEIDANMTVEEAHNVTDALEREIFDAFPKAEVIIHQEPAGIEDERLDDVIAGRGKGGIE
ncbi:MAG: cation diffusion facilitator family transporter [Geminicoccaceae bacterium]|nr:cation diffusion facilitator family transporter [Geminicoccaceae bacterium]